MHRRIPVFRPSEIILKNIHSARTTIRKRRCVKSLGDLGKKGYWAVPMISMAPKMENNTRMCELKCSGRENGVVKVMVAFYVSFPCQVSSTLRLVSILQSLRSNQILWISYRATKFPRTFSFEQQISMIARSRGCKWDIPIFEFNALRSRIQCSNHSCFPSLTPCCLRFFI